MSVNRKISNLPAVIGSSILDADIVPLVASGVTSYTTIANLRIKIGANPPAGGRTVTDAASYLANNAVFNVKDFGAFGDNSHNDTVAAQLAYSTAAAFAVANGTGAAVYWPKGLYLITDTIVVNAHRLHTYGDGKWATTLNFNPASAKSMFKAQFTNTALTINQGSFKRFGVTGAGTQQKIIIDFLDQSEWVVEDVIMNGGLTGGTTIGIRTAGREFLSLERVTIFADRPIHITVNANAASLSADHFHFHDMYLGPLVSTEAAILVDAACGVANFVLDGYQSYVGGKYGVRGLSGGGVTALIVNFSNIRMEQPADNTGFAVDWQLPTTTFMLTGCNLGGTGTPTNGGLRLRAVTHSILVNVQYTGSGAAATALDMDSTCRTIRFVQCFFQDSSVVSMPGFEELEGLSGSNTLSPIRGNSYWFLTAFGRPIVYRNGVATHKAQITLGVGATYTLLVSSIKTARLWVSAWNVTGPTRAAGFFHLDGTGSTVAVDTYANLAAVNTGGKFCTIWTSASNIQLINNLAQSVTVLVEVEYAV